MIVSQTWHRDRCHRHGTETLQKRSTNTSRYICIYFIVNSPLDSGSQRATNHADSTRKHRTGRALRSKSLLGRAPQPPAARNRCSGVPRSLLAFEITARARFFVFGNTRKRRPSVSARSRGSSKRRWIRQRFRVSCGIPFEIPFGIALLRTLHCFELCFARLHRHRQVPYANLVYIYIYIYMKPARGPQTMFFC